MSGVPSASACGTLQSCDHLNWSTLVCEDPETYYLPLPVSDERSAAAFLKELGGGGPAGAGNAMQRIGVSAPQIRQRYKREIEAMVEEVTRRLRAGESKEEIARWVSGERNAIIARVRAHAGPVGRAIYEIRDRREYGPGGRPWHGAQFLAGYPSPTTCERTSMRSMHGWRISASGDAEGTSQDGQSSRVLVAPVPLQGVARG